MYERGQVIKGPDLVAGNAYRPYVCLSDDSHPFSDEEAIYAAATTTRRSVAVPLSEGDFKRGGLPRKTFINPWTLVTIRHDDMQAVEGVLINETTETIARRAGEYLGIS